MNTIGCSECNRPSIGPITDSQVLVRAWVLCPECLEKIPESLFEEVMKAIKQE